MDREGNVSENFPVRALLWCTHQKARNCYFFDLRNKNF